MTTEVALEGVKKDVEYIRERMDDFVQAYEKIDKRIKNLEDWKLVFVTKFSVYSAVALVIGSFMAQLALKYLSRLI